MGSMLKMSSVIHHPVLIGIRVLVFVIAFLHAVLIAQDQINVWVILWGFAFFLDEARLRAWRLDHPTYD